MVKQEREFLDDEKQKLQSEIQQMEKLNKITENKVKARTYQMVLFLGEAKLVLLYKIIVVILVFWYTFGHQTI